MALSISILNNSVDTTPRIRHTAGGLNFTPTIGTSAVIAFFGYENSSNQATINTVTHNVPGASFTKLTQFTNPNGTWKSNAEVWIATNMTGDLVNATIQANWLATKRESTAFVIGVNGIDTNITSTNIIFTGSLGFNGGNPATGFGHTIAAPTGTNVVDFYYINKDKAPSAGVTGPGQVAVGVEQIVDSKSASWLSKTTTTGGSVTKTWTNTNNKGGAELSYVMMKLEDSGGSPAPTGNGIMLSHNF